MELYRHGFHLEVFSRIDARQHPRSGMDQPAKPHARLSFASTRFTLTQKPTLSGNVSRLFPRRTLTHRARGTATTAVSNALIRSLRGVDELEILKLNLFVKVTRRKIAISLERSAHVGELMDHSAE